MPTCLALGAPGTLFSWAREPGLQCRWVGGRSVPAGAGMGGGPGGLRPGRLMGTVLPQERCPSQGPHLCSAAGWCQATLSCGAAPCSVGCLAAPSDADSTFCAGSMSQQCPPHRQGPRGLERALALSCIVLPLRCFVCSVASSAPRPPSACSRPGALSSCRQQPLKPRHSVTSGPVPPRGARVREIPHAAPLTLHVEQSPSLLDLKGPSEPRT